MNKMDFLDVMNGISPFTEVVVKIGSVKHPIKVVVADAKEIVIHLEFATVEDKEDDA